MSSKQGIINMIDEKALIKAASLGNIEQMQTYLDKGVDINSQDSDYHYFTALHYSVQKGYLALCQLLLTRGADVNQRDNNGDNALQIAIICTHHSGSVIEVVNLLLKHGALFDIPLLEHVYQGGKQAIQKILTTDFVNQTDSNGYTALHYACARAQQEIISQLYQKGGNLSIASQNKRTPLLVAAYRGQLEIVKWLLENGASLSEKNEYGSTALLLAASHGHLKTVQWLLYP